MPSVTRIEFESLIARAVRALPDDFRSRMESLVIQAADAPTGAQLREAGITDPEDTLYGWFEGTPLPERSLHDVPVAVDRILVFQRPLEEDFGDDEEALVDEIRITLLHEIGHYFGMSEDELDRLGYG